MKTSKREFIKNLGFAGAAGAVGALAMASAKAQTDEIKAGATNSSVFNVKDFGAFGDGVTPDSEAIQKALDAAGEVQGTVYFPSGKYLCHDLKVRPHTTVMSEPQWAYGGDAGAMLVLDSEEADCVLNVTGAFGAHIKGLFLFGKRECKKEIHGIFLNNDKEFSKKEDSIVIDDCQVRMFSGSGVHLLRVWLFIIRHSYFRANKKHGIYIFGWDGFVLDNQISDNGSHGMFVDKWGGTIMFTANRVEWNKGCGYFAIDGGSTNFTGNCFDCNWGAAIDLRKCSTITISANVFRRCGREDNIEGEDMSCQVNLDGCKGLAMNCNSSGAGRRDGAKGEVRPKYGLKVKNMSYSVITDNSFFGGFTDKMVFDAGGHGEQFVMSDNVGCPAGK